MEEKNKVLVFEKSEIILVLIFVVVLIITSFTLGIRLGKKLAFNESGIKDEDVKTVQLKSATEEDVENTITEDSKLTDDEKLKKLMDESKARMNDELEKFSSEVAPVSVAPEATQKSSMTGKFTIQLGSYNTLDEAKQFAEGFTVRGYSPILNEVKIDGKGVWYRVSLGLFNNVDEAKSYIKQEQSLFSGQDHVISEIK
jgi:cell division protein FtsN